MRMSDAKIAQLEKQLADTDKLAVYQDTRIKYLEAKLARKVGGYVLHRDDITELAAIFDETKSMRLERFLDELEPRWRTE